MTDERLFVIFEDNESFFVEKPEAERIKQLLDEIPALSGWTLLSSVAKRLGQRCDQTAATARLLRAAQRIEKETPYGNETIAHAPILKIRKDRYNKRKNATGRNYMRAPIYIKRPDK